jgi:RimJ/RimL family protein N-acetyltransferase
LQTERFELRSLKPIDASDRWVGWARDPEVMGPLNSAVAQVTRGELGGYIGSADNIHRFIIGVFDKLSRIQIGFFMVEVDNAHRIATFNVVVGEKAWWGKGVINESRAALLDHFFNDRGIEKACGQPLGPQFPGGPELQDPGLAARGDAAGTAPVGGGRVAARSVSIRPAAQ